MKLLWTFSLLQTIAIIYLFCHHEDTLQIRDINAYSINARRLNLVDENNQPSVRMWADVSESQINFYNRKGKNLLRLGTTLDQSHFLMASGNARVACEVRDGKLPRASITEGVNGTGYSVLTDLRDSHVQWHQYSPPLSNMHKDHQ